MMWRRDRVKRMIAIPKKIVVDDHGKPQEVIIPWKKFCELCEALGLDLDEPAQADLRVARREWSRRNLTAFKSLSVL